MVDMDAQHSVLTLPAPRAQSQSKRLGYRELPSWASTHGLLEDRWTLGRVRYPTHSWSCLMPIPLLERDLLTKVGAQISLEKDRVTVTDSGGNCN